MFDWSIITSNYPLWLTGLMYTCLLTAISCIFGTILSIMLALLLRVRHGGIRMVTQGIIEVFKSIPLLALLVAINYVLPVLWHAWSFSAFWNSVIAFSANLAAFMAEVLRGGMDAIPKGHIEAAEALGISRVKIVRRIILPETIRRTVPSVVVLYIGLLKLSTLASIIGVQELLFNARLINIQTAEPVEVYTSLTIAFVFLIVPLSWGARILEKKRCLMLNPTSKTS